MSLENEHRARIVQHLPRLFGELHELVTVRAHSNEGDVECNVPVGILAFAASTSPGMTVPAPSWSMAQQQLELERGGCEATLARVATPQAVHLSQIPRAVCRMRAAPDNTDARQGRRLDSYIPNQRKSLRNLQLHRDRMRV